MSDKKTTNPDWLPVDADVNTNRYDNTDRQLIAALQATGHIANMRQGATSGSGYYYFSADISGTEGQWATVTVKQDAEGDLYIVGRMSRIIDNITITVREGTYRNGAWRWGSEEVRSR